MALYLAKSRSRSGEGGYGTPRVIRKGVEVFLKTRSIRPSMRIGGPPVSMHMAAVAARYPRGVRVATSRLKFASVSRVAYIAAIRGEK